ncbi:hypothetical protein KS4_35360 [Poriferisphaera corsica]|uniref:DUF3631 domain-containing protein n=1 Tax=Poriferisphaera corsica TaxID=2528020 RepID=A0A517YZ04_9BACT|nr:hypothetical protein [Poriferisphaera corsica]QDU35453.1 hypothetical protein KS4_35360 [Poriferisphaera corsica]
MNEVDPRYIIRPNQIIQKNIAAFTIPIITTQEGEPIGQWQLYQQFPDGSREVSKLDTTLQTPAGTTYYFHPFPSPPAIAKSSGWSAKARKQWLEAGTQNDPTETFNTVHNLITRYIDFNHDQAEGIVNTLTLWIMHTHIYGAWEATPYLHINGPAGSGKSRVFEVLNRLVYRPMNVSNTTPAPLFRQLDEQGGTLLLDEAERMQERTPEVSELRSILLAGYKKDGKAARCEGDNHASREFNVYSPKALACIEGLPHALSTRCIRIMMFRAGKDSQCYKRRIDEQAKHWQQARDKLHTLTLEQGVVWLQLAKRTDVCPNLHGRDYELWQPLLSLASFFESQGVADLHAGVLDFAYYNHEQGKQDKATDIDATLLRIAARMILTQTIAPTAQEIINCARLDEAETFDRITPRKTASILKAYGLTTQKSNGKRIYNNISRKDFQRIQQNYGLDLDLPKQETQQQTITQQDLDLLQVTPNTEYIPALETCPTVPSVLAREAIGHEGYVGY